MAGKGNEMINVMIIRNRRKGEENERLRTKVNMAGNERSIERDRQEETGR